MQEKSRADILLSAKRPLLCLALLTPYLLCWLYVKAYGVNTPLSDDFTFVFFYRLLNQGSIGIFQLLDAQHNEHRCGLPYLLTLGLAKLTHYNTVVNMYLGVVFVGATLAVMLYFLWPKLKQAEISPFALVPIAWLICSVRQTQNLLMAFQGAYQSAFFLILCLFLLDGVKTLSLRFWVAAVCAFLSAFSFGNGLLALPIGFLLLVCKFWLDGKESFLQRRDILVAWIVVSLSIVTAYFWGFTTAVGQGKVTLEFLMQSPGKVLAFALGFIASPVAHEEVNALALGLLFLLLCLTCVIAFILKPKAITAEIILPAMLICFALLSGVMATFGRAQLGMEASFVSRYATMANYGWIGLYLLLLFGQELGQGLRRGLIGITLLCLTMGAFTTAMTCRLDGLIYRDLELNAENVIRSYPVAGPKALIRCIGLDAGDLVALIQFMVEKRLSVFSQKQLSCDPAHVSSADSPYWSVIDFANGKLTADGKSIPTINLDRAKETDVSLTGWVADLHTGKLPRAVWVVIDHHLGFTTAYGLTRTAVAESTNRDFLLTSGFAVAFRLDLLSKGEHDLQLTILSREGGAVFKTPTLLHLSVK